MDSYHFETILCSVGIFSFWIKVSTTQARILKKKKKK